MDSLCGYYGFKKKCSDTNLTSSSELSENFTILQPAKLFYLKGLLRMENILKTLLTPMGDQDRISLYNINTISSRRVMRIKTILTRSN